jgi:hypothetical protein
MLEFISSLFGSELFVAFVVGIVAGAILLLEIVINVSLLGGVPALGLSCGGSGFDIL